MGGLSNGRSPRPLTPQTEGGDKLPVEIAAKRIEIDRQYGAIFPQYCGAFLPQTAYLLLGGMIYYGFREYSALLPSFKLNVFLHIQLGQCVEMQISMTIFSSLRVELIYFSCLTFFKLTDIISKFISNRQVSPQASLLSCVFIVDIGFSSIVNCLAAFVVLGTISEGISVITLTRFSYVSLGSVQRNMRLKSIVVQCRWGFSSLHTEEALPG